MKKFILTIGLIYLVAFLTLTPMFRFRGYVDINDVSSTRTTWFHHSHPKAPTSAPIIGKTAINYVNENKDNIQGFYYNVQHSLLSFLSPEPSIYFIKYNLKDKGIKIVTNVK